MDDDDVLGLVLGKLDGVVQHGGYWMARCPAHEDGRASLSVGRGTEQPIVLNCHAGCDAAAVLDAIGLTLADISAPRDRAAAEMFHGDPVIATYDYTDEHGRALFQVCRTALKQFPQRRPGSARRWGIGNVRRVPYHLPQLLEAVRAGRVVHVVEGEKDVEAIERAGGVATCNPGGAGKWREQYDEPFRGAEVVIVADRDEPGRKHAADVAGHLRPVARSVRIAEAATGKDASDHLGAGHGLGEFRAADGEDRADVGEDQVHGELAAIAGRYTPVDWEVAWKGRTDGVDWLIPPILEAGTVNVLYAKPGVGKSLLALQMALMLVRDGRTVVYVDDENRVSDVVERLQAYGADPGELARLLLYSFAGLPPLDTATGGAHLLALAATADAALVTLDATTRMIQGRENDADTFLQLYLPCRGRPAGPR